MICQFFTRSAILLHGLFSAICDTELLSSSSAFTVCRFVVNFATCFFELLNRLVLFLELIKTITRWLVALV